MMMKTLLKWLMYISLVVVGLIIWASAGTIGEFVGRNAVTEYQAVKKEGILEQAQIEAAKLINKQTPIRVDEITTLESVASVNTTVMYNYKLKTDKSNLNLELFKNDMSRQLKTNACSNEKTAKVLDLGGGYIYNYLDINGIFIADFTVTKKDCH